MSAATSPGPWTLALGDDHEVIDAPRTAWTLHSCDGDVICGGGDAYCAGDPLVLKAAPDLRDAVRDIVAAHSIADPLERMTACAAALTAARFAYLKATGEHLP